MESFWHQVEYILRCVDEASCDEDTHTHSVHFVHEGMLGPSNCSKLRTEQGTGQNSDVFNKLQAKVFSVVLARQETVRSQK